MTHDSTAQHERVKRNIYHTLRRYTKETYNKDLHKRPTKETYKRNLQKRPNYDI